MYFLIFIYGASFPLCPLLHFAHICQNISTDISKQQAFNYQSNADRLLKK